MINLNSRQEIKTTKLIIATAIAGLQKVFFEDVELYYYENENERQEYLSRFDFVEIERIKIETINKIIGINHPEITTFTTELARKLQILFSELGMKEFYILSHLKLNLFGNLKNKYKPLVKAYKQLENIVGKRNYYEAISFGIDDLPEIIDILFWITRYDMSIPEYIFIFDQEEKIQIHLCKYGNLHLTEFKNEIISTQLLKANGWEIIEGDEFDQFKNNGEIEGRMLKV